MGYCVVHMQKMKMSAAGGIQSHINREHESKTNADIDYEKTKNNYDFISTSNLRDDIKMTIDDIVNPKKSIRKDAVVCCNFVITSDYDTMSKLNPEEQKQFFEDTVQFFGDRYGFNKIIYANVHLDEKTPHMHLGLVPITQDNRLSCKTLFTPVELKNLQTAFYERVGVRYGMVRGIEGSTNKHIETQRYKKQTLMQDIKEMTNHLERMKKTLDQSKKLESKVELLEKQVQEREEEIKVLDDIISKKISKGVDEGHFSMRTLKEDISKMKEEQKEKNLFHLLKKFVELPAIAPLWQRFVMEQERAKRKLKVKSNQLEK